jgi:phage repressor protein C with HTH and peptisase S24 domain/DNA-binding XRE family transcriptional regulator
MTEDGTHIRDELKRLRNRAGLSVRAMAKALEMPATTYANYETRFKKPFLPMDFAQGLVKVLEPYGIDPKEVFSLAGVEAAVDVPDRQPFGNHAIGSLSHQAVNESIEFNAIPAPDAALPPLMTSMPKDVPVLGTAECGPDGVFEMNGGDALDFVRRPPGLVGNKRAFAVYAQGDSMRPMFHSGDPVYVDPNRPPEIDRAVLVEFLPLEGEHPRGMLKILVKMNSEFIELRQLNPDNSDKPIRFDRKKIKRIYRVLTNQDMMGF